MAKKYLFRSLIALFTASIVLMIVPQLATAQGGGSISGAISTADGGMPEMAEVNLHKLNSTSNPPTWEYSIQVTTADYDTGAYSFTGLEAGTYRIYSFDSGMFTEYADEFYDGASDFDSATDIIVGQNEQVTGIDIELDPSDPGAPGSGASISGTISSVSGGLLDFVEVWLYQLYTDNGDPFWDVVNNIPPDNATGEYTFDNLFEGTYRIYVQDISGDPAFASEYYDAASDFDSATDIVIVQDEQITGIDVELDALGIPSTENSISGTISAISPISGDSMASLTVELYKAFNNADGPPDWFVIHSISVNVDGTYAFSDLETDTYRLGIVDHNYPPLYQNQYYSNATVLEDATDIIMAEGAIVTDIDIEIGELGKIAGTVTDMDGNPLANVLVSAFNNSYGYWSNDSGSVLTKADGSYLLAGLPSGNVRVKFDGNHYEIQPPAHAAKFYDNAQDVESATDIVVSVNSTVSGIDAQLAKLASISGKVTDLNGSPIADASVSMYKQNDDGSFESLDGAQVDQNGDYTVVGLEAGTYRIGIWPNSSSEPFVSEYYNNAANLESATDIVVGEGENVTNINAELAQLGAISGTVTDMDGNPLANIPVTALINDDGIWGRSISAYTEADGSYILTNLQPSNVRLKFATTNEEAYDYGREIPSYAMEYYNDAPDIDSAMDIVVVLNSTVSGIDAQLAELASISGKVTDPNGNPVADTSVNMYKQRDNGSFFNISSAMTDQNGEYTAANLDTGTYRLEVQQTSQSQWADEFYNNAANLESATDIIVETSAVLTDFDIQLGELGRLSGTVTDEENNPLSNIPVTLYRETDWFGEWDEVATVSTDISGAYQFTNLPTGEFYVGFATSLESSESAYIAEYYDDTSNAQLIAVGPSAPTFGIDAQLAKAYSIQGTITDSAGNPIADVRVDLYNEPSDSGARSINTDQNGQYAFYGLGTSSYQLYAFSWDYQPIYYDNARTIESATDIVVADGEDVIYVDMTLNRKSTISGSVLDANGNIITDANPSIVLYTVDEYGQWNENYRSESVQDGQYIFDNLDDNTYRLKVRGAGQYHSEFYNNAADVESAVDITVSDGEIIVLDDIWLDRLGSISGVVTNSQGQPVGGIHVTAYQYDSNGEYWAERQEATTNGDGTYTLEGIAVGTYKILFSDRKYFSDDFEYGREYYNDAPDIESALEIIVALSENVVGIDAQLGEPSKITGTITDAGGNPLTDVNISLYEREVYGDGEIRWDYWNGDGSSYSDENGVFSFGTENELHPGVYRACFYSYSVEYLYHCYGGADDVQNAVDIIVGLNETVSNIDTTMVMAGAISGTVRNADDITLEGIVITLYRYQSDTEEWIQVEQIQGAELNTKTDENGTYNITQLLPGTYRLQFTGDEFLAQQFYTGASTLEEATDVTVGSGLSVTDIDVQLVQRTAIRGKITDENNVALQSIFVGVYRQAEMVTAQTNVAPTNEIWDLVRSETTNAFGQYTIYDLEPGTYRVGFNNSETLYHSEFFGNNAYYISQATDLVISEGRQIEDVNATMAGISLNVPPLAVQDAMIVDEAGEVNELVGLRRSLLANDADAENATLTAMLIISPTHGTLELNADGTFLYQHDGSETLNDAFSYVASDGTHMSDVISVTITVQPQNDVPVATADSINVAQGGMVGKLASGEASVLINDSDAESDNLRVDVGTTPTAGTLILNADGTFSYQHDGSTTLTDSFTYIVSDGTNSSDETTVTITVTETAPVVESNSAPVAAEDSITVDQGGTADKLSTGMVSVVLNDSDAESAELSAVLVQEPEFGTLILNADGSFVYQHSGGNSNTDSFTYKVSDGESESEPATVTIQIMPVSTNSMLYLPVVTR